jgi:hypothetical protein
VNVVQRKLEAIREEISLRLETNLEKAIEKGVTNALRSFGACLDNQQEAPKDFITCTRFGDALKP